jgi:hypothetical protein
MNVFEVFLLPEISGSYILSLRMQSPDRFGILLLCQEQSIVILITMSVALTPGIIICIFKPSFNSLCSLGEIIINPLIL